MSLDAGARADETPEQTLDRNWSGLLQELRVVQTGVMLLSGFLLTLTLPAAVQPAVGIAAPPLRATVAAACLATVLLVAPVMLHRILFRQHERDVMVTAARRRLPSA